MLNISKYQMIGYDNGGKKNHTPFKTVSGESKSMTPEMVYRW